MPVVTSKDGTEIAYSRVGDGPALIIVCGATQFRAFDLAKLTILSLNTAHTDEHYGNMVTYMRLKGLVPPTSESQQSPPSKK